ncbi:MAG: hypothetical protein MK321_13765 [Pseudomonadales bacterium]|nr:hypothetical protein [Pseudomonadales bacterium]
MFVAQAMLVRQAPELAFGVVLPPKWAHITLGPEANPAYVAFLLANDDTKCRNVAPDTCEPERPASVNPVEQEVQAVRIVPSCIKNDPYHHLFT